jgi:hypothetical protein
MQAALTRREVLNNIMDPKLKGSRVPSDCTHAKMTRPSPTRIKAAAATIQKKLADTQKAHIYSEARTTRACHSEKKNSPEVMAGTTLTGWHE